MNRTLRGLALPIATALMLAGCSIPFELVPKDDDEATTVPIETEDAETEVAIEETSEPEVTGEPAAEEAPEETVPPDTDGDGKANYSASPEEVLPMVVELCGLPADVLGDEGMTMILDSPGADPDSGTLPVEDSGCAIGYLNPPDWLMEEISSTKIGGERQEAVDGYITYSWTLSNEDGLDFIVRVTDEAA